MSVIEITSMEQFNELISKNDVLVDFYAEWCVPCKNMAPILNQLANAHDQLVIVKANIEIMEDLAVQHRIRAVPTLVLYKNNTAVKTITGAKNLNELQQFVSG